MTVHVAIEDPRKAWTFVEFCRSLDFVTDVRVAPDSATGELPMPHDIDPQLLANLRHQWEKYCSTPALPHGTFDPA